MVTTKQKFLVNKIKRKKSKPTATESHQIKDEESKRRRKEQWNYKTFRKHLTNGSKYILTNNYFKYKWTKFSNQKT